MQSVVSRDSTRVCVCVYAALNNVTSVQARMLLEDPDCAAAILKNWHPLLEETLTKCVARGGCCCCYAAYLQEMCVWAPCVQDFM